MPRVALSIRKLVSLAMIVTSLIFCPTAQADGCNIANLLFGKVRIEQAKSTSIIIGNDFDSQRFRYGNILGQIAGSERDDSRRISDLSQNVCGILQSNMQIDTSEAECKSCSKSRISLKKVGPGFVVLSDGKIMGTIEGKLPQ